MTNISSELSGKFRECQRSAISTAQEFLKTPSQGKSCLICLPTGAGKTGVISVVAQEATFERILIISHRRAVCDQLAKEISGAFFKKLKPEHSFNLKAVHELNKDAKKQGIYITTFQKLTMLEAVDFERIKTAFGLVIVDEGHSEPAPIWSKIARSMTAHKLIITATPYRNDLFQFDIGSSQSYIYSFKEAVSADILNDPIFEQLTELDIKDRIKILLDKQKGTKCIVKCKRFEDVEHYYNLLSQHYLVLAIHDRYQGKNAGQNKRVSVPKDIKEHKAEIIIHQNKLDEGVDIPEAKILVLTYPVSNGRELVQTIGRVIRKEREFSAYVLDLSVNSNEKMWRNYREFDEYISNPIAWQKFLKSLDTAALIENYLDAFPDNSYLDAEFKKKFDISSFDPNLGLSIPLASVCFIEKLHDFNISAFCDTIYWKLTRQGELVRHISNCHGFEIILSVSFKNSPFLSNELFFEPKLELLVAKEENGIVAIYDSRSINYSFEEELSLGPAIPIDKLLSLAARSSRVKTKEAHTSAIGTTVNRPEGIAIRGGSLDRSAPPQSNAGYALTTLRVDNIDEHDKKHSSYYLGINAGRVSDQKNRKFTLERLSDWVQDIIATIESKSKTKSELLNSYAKPIIHTPREDPVSILLDMTSLTGETTITLQGKNHKLTPDFVFSNYENGFHILAESEAIPFKVSLNKETNRLDISSSHPITFSDPQQSEIDFLKWINQQGFKALYKDGVSYNDGKFYKITLPSERGINIEDMKISSNIISIAELTHSSLSEKGQHCTDNGYLNTTADNFDCNSVFYLIDSLKKFHSKNLPISEYGPFYEHIPNCDLIVCTDMGTEPADFIVSSPTKLCFVHVKCGKSVKPNSSAGALAEVGGQAIKNIEMLISKNKELRPANFTRWQHSWPSKDAKFPLEHRVRLIDGMRPLDYIANNISVTKEKLAELAIQKIIERRSSDAIKKEIWIIVGNSFSRGHLIKEMGKGENASSETLQGYQLIDSWTSIASMNDVTFNIFTSP